MYRPWTALANKPTFLYNGSLLRSLFTRYESLFVSGWWKVAEAVRWPGLTGPVSIERAGGWS